MSLTEIVAAIDTEITRLQLARALLAGDADPDLKVTRKSKSALSRIEVRAKPAKPRNLTTEGRQRIADAARRRWSLQKKAGSQ